MVSLLPKFRKMITEKSHNNNKDPSCSCNLIIDQNQRPSTASNRILRASEDNGDVIIYAKERMQNSAFFNNDLNYGNALQCVSIIYFKFINCEDF